MFPATAFAPRYFAPRYWAKLGDGDGTPPVVVSNGERRRRGYIGAVGSVLLMLLVGCAATPHVEEGPATIRFKAASDTVWVPVSRACLPFIGVRVDSIEVEGQMYRGPFQGVLCRQPVRTERWHGPPGKVGG